MASALQDQVARTLSCHWLSSRSPVVIPVCPTDTHFGKPPLDLESEQTALPMFNAMKETLTKLDAPQGLVHS